MSGPTPDQVRAAFARYTAAVEGRDREALLACLAGDVEQVDPYPSAPNVGREAVAAFFDQTWAMTDRLEFVPGHAIVAADRGVFPFTVRSYFEGGTVVEIDVVDVMTINPDGLISAITAYADSGGMRTSQA